MHGVFIMTSNNSLNKPACSPIRQLITALAPLIIGILVSGLLAYYSDKLIDLFFGDVPKKTRGYFILVLILLPFVVAAIYSEWLLNRAIHQDPQD